MFTNTIPSCPSDTATAAATAAATVSCATASA